MTNTDEKKKAPVLATLDDESVGRWAEAHDVYSKRGGKHRLRDCIDNDVLEMIELLDIDVEEHETDADKAAKEDAVFMIANVRRVFAAPTTDAARAVLESIGMGADFEVPPVTAYVLAYTNHRLQGHPGY